MEREGMKVSYSLCVSERDTRGTVSSRSRGKEGTGFEVHVSTECEKRAGWNGWRKV